MQDISISYNRYKFIGYEFLTWIWFCIEHNRIKDLESGPVSLSIGNRIVCENRRHEDVETVIIKGNDAGLEEGVLALRKGGVVTELNLTFTADDKQWNFTIKGDSLNISSLKTPETGAVETKDDIEGIILEKGYLYETVIRFIHRLFKRFIRLRLSEDWKSKALPEIREWIGI